MEAKTRKAWSFVPSLYFAEGLPYCVVMVLSIIVFKRLGVDNARIAFWTSVLNLPWVFKPLWSPLVDIYHTKRGWVWSMQILLAVCFALLAFGVHTPLFFPVMLCALALSALLSATHDIAADGFYIHGLDENQQALWSGIRNTAYRTAMLTCQGLLVIAAGYMEENTGLAATRFEVRCAETARRPVAVQTAPGRDIIVSPLPLTVEPGAEREISLSLARRPEPGKTHTVIFGRKSGDKDIGLKSTQELRFVFNETNWDQSQKVTICAAKRALPGAAAVFRASAGNIKLSWSLVFAFLALMTFGLGLYHKIILPRPESDQPGNPRAPLWKAAFWLALAMLLPAAALKGLFSITGIFVPAAAKGATGLAFALGRLAAMGLVLGAALRISSVRDRLAAFFVHMAKKSRIGFDDVFTSFFKRPKIVTVLGFLLLYRLAEAQLARISSAFLIDAQEAGGLALGTADLGMVYGGVGLVCLLSGGILGGVLVSRVGLARCLVFMWACINVPDLVYIYMAYALPDSLTVVSLCVGIEQLGYGIGFTGYMLYMLEIAGTGRWKVSHYAICTGFMALGMMLPGMVSGYIQQILGYRLFFVWVVLCTLPGLVLLRYIPLSRDFGLRKDS